MLKVSEHSRAGIAPSSFIWHEINHSHFAWRALCHTYGTYIGTYTYIYIYICNWIEHAASTHAPKKVSRHAKECKHKVIYQQIYVTQTQTHNKQLKHIHIKLQIYLHAYISMLLGAQLLLVCWPLDIALPQQLKGLTDCLPASLPGCFGLTTRLNDCATDRLTDWPVYVLTHTHTHTHKHSRLRPWFWGVRCCLRAARRLLLCLY